MTPRTRVMIVDDSTTIRRCAQMFLQQAGCEVILADNGFDALAKVETHAPDLILMDVMMPRLDGFQACALIKNSKRRSATPVVLLSSKDTVMDQARGRLAGSIAHLSKPFTKDNLLKVVEEHAISTTRAQDTAP